MILRVTLAESDPNVKRHRTPSILPSSGQCFGFTGAGAREAAEIQRRAVPGTSRRQRTSLGRYGRVKFSDPMDSARAKIHGDLQTCWEMELERQKMVPAARFWRKDWVGMGGLTRDFHENVILEPVHRMGPAIGQRRHHEPFTRRGSLPFPSARLLSVVDQSVTRQRWFQVRFVVYSVSRKVGIFRPYTSGDNSMPSVVFELYFAGSVNLSEVISTR